MSQFETKKMAVMNPIMQLMKHQSTIEDLLKKDMKDRPLVLTFLHHSDTPAIPMVMIESFFLHRVVLDIFHVVDIHRCQLDDLNQPFVRYILLHLLELNLGLRMDLEDFAVVLVFDCWKRKVVGGYIVEDLGTW